MASSPEDADDAGPAPEWSRSAAGLWTHAPTGLQQRARPPSVAQNSVGRHYDTITSRSRLVPVNYRTGIALGRLRKFNNWVVSSAITASARHLMATHAAKAGETTARARGLRVLDFAGGKGGAVAKLAHSGCPIASYTLADTSPASVAEGIARAARELDGARTHIRGVCVDLRSPTALDDLCHDVAEDTWDLVLFNFAINYFASSEEALTDLFRRIHGCMAPLGVMNVTWLAQDNLEGRLRPDGTAGNLLYSARSVPSDAAGKGRGPEKAACVEDGVEDRAEKDGSRVGDSGDAAGAGGAGGAGGDSTAPGKHRETDRRAEALHGCGTRSYWFTLPGSVEGCREYNLSIAALEGCAAAAGLDVVNLCRNIAAWPDNPIRLLMGVEQLTREETEVCSLYACAILQRPSVDPALGSPYLEEPTP